MPPASTLAALKVPRAPEDLPALLEWVQRYGLGPRLDDVLIGKGGQVPGAYLPGRGDESLTYRQILFAETSQDRRQMRYFDLGSTARDYLHRMATLLERHRANRSWLDEHGRDPEDEVLMMFMRRLQAGYDGVVFPSERGPRPPGTFAPRRVTVARNPVPMLVYQETTLTQSIEDTDVRSEEMGVLLLGWEEGDLRWGDPGSDRHEQIDVPATKQSSAFAAMIDFLRDPRQLEQHETLAELLRLPAWKFALGTLDEDLSRLRTRDEHESSGPSRRREQRLAFRVTVLPDGALDIDPISQKRGKNGLFSTGARMDWFHVPHRSDLTEADRRVYQAYEDRFARETQTWRWGGPLRKGQAFGILRALIDHPAVFMDGERDTTRRLDIRQGRLRLRFGTASTRSMSIPGVDTDPMMGALSPQFELLGVTLLAPEIERALNGDRYLMHLYRPNCAEGAEVSPVQILLAELSPQAAAVVHALAVAPTRFPAESHDALALRLEPLQESMDIEFPSQWTRTIAPADGRMLARLEMLASGAIQVRLAVRPVKLGPTFPPGEGPTLVLEGQGHERHGARRDPHGERQTARALAEHLNLNTAPETEPWSWRVNEGDSALHLVSQLKDLAAEVSVEWADDARLFSLGSAGRGEIRLRVADRRDWFQVEGGLEIEAEVVPLAVLFAAIRDGRRYIPVGARGFVRIEDTLREALAHAELMVFDSRGTLQVAAVGSDSLMGLVEHESQVKASAAFSRLRKRMRQSAFETPELPASLDATLRPYQKAGITWLARLAHWGAGAILADEMGLGKTVQTLAVLGLRAALGPAIVVAPTSVVPNWIAEAARFTPELRIRLYRGNARASLLQDLGPGDVVVTSYAIATLDAEALARVAFGSLVLDEAQAVKNATTERAKALRDLNAEWRLGLTGTPIENHLGELWSILRVLSPGLLGSWEQFRARYAVPIEKFGDDQRRRALALVLRPFILRRLKSEVARELPARTEVVRVVRLSAEEQALYEELRQATIAEIAAAKKDPDRDAQGMRFILLASLTRLRQLCCHPRLVYPNTLAGSSKAAHLLDLLGDLRESGHKVLVFSQFRSFLDLLAPRLRQHGFRVLVLDGMTRPEAREQRVAAFQAGQAEVFLISLKAGGFGLNLTAADTVIHMDPWWNPAVEDQATARAHRIGQDRPVTAVRLVARGTIEEAVLGLHDAKRALAAGILDGTDVAASLDTDELIKLITRGFDVAS